MKKRKTQKPISWYQKKNWGIIFSIILFTFILYKQGILFGFVRDDTYHLHRNFYLQKFSLTSLAGIWTKVYWGLYIPVTYSFWALLKFVGDFFSENPQVVFDPHIFHFANIFVHCLNGILVFFILKQFSQNKTAALIGTLFFIAHPMQVESVIWISEMRGLLSNFFGLLLILYHLADNKGDVTRRYRIRHILVEIFIFILAIFSKPTAVIYPFLLFIFDVLVLKKQIRNAIVSFVPFFIFMIAFSFFMFFLITNNEKDYVSSFILIRPFIWADSFNFYLFKTIFPVNLAASYGRTTEYILKQWWFYPGILIPLFLLIVTLKYKNQYSTFFTGTLIFIIGFLPVSGIVGHSYQAWSNVADRYVYTSMLGVSLIISYVMTFEKHRKIIRGSGILILLLFFIYNHKVLIPAWKNELVLWEHCVKVTPNNAKVYLARGEQYMKHKMRNKAINDYNTALSIKPDASGYNNRGLVYYETGNYNLALKDYNKSIELDPEYANAYNNRGNLYIAMGDLEKALTDIEKTITLQPNDGRPYINKGIIFMKQNKPADALVQFDLGYQQGGKIPELLLNRGILYKSLNRYTEAIEDLLEYTKLNPSSDLGYYHLGQAYFFKKDYLNAILFITKYIRMNPKHGDSYYNRAKAYFYTGNFQQALNDINTAVKLGTMIDPAFYDIITQKPQ